MCQQLEWTKELGEAFKADQKGVMDAIQRKRMQAQQVGNLKSSPQMTVNTKTDNGKQVVEITPANPQVVYVPQYNTTTVYTTPPPAQTTVVQESSGVSTGAAIGIGLLSFGVGMAVGSAFNNNNYYPYPGWGGGGMYYGGRPYYPPPYRPPVYRGYRPAYGYNPPGNYHWNQYNRQVNVNIHNNNYYDRFNNNSRTAIRNNNNNTYLGARNNNRPGLNDRSGARGSSTYLGARPQTGQRPGASMAKANPRLANKGANVSRPNAGNISSRNVSRPNGSSGFNTANRGGVTPGNGDRGFGNAGAGQSRPARQNQPAVQTRSMAQNRPGNGGGAFGGGGNGRADRAASSRGRSSMGASAPARAGGHGRGGGRGRR